MEEKHITIASYVKPFMTHYTRLDQRSKPIDDIFAIDPFLIANHDTDLELHLRLFRVS